MAKYDISHLLSGPKLITSTIQPQIGLDSGASPLPAHLPSFAESPAGSNYIQLSSGRVNDSESRYISPNRGDVSIATILTLLFSQSSFFIVYKLKSLPL